VCDDKNACTTDFCDPLIGCTAKNVADATPCADASCSGVNYTGQSLCATGKCVAPAVKVCDDKLECTTDTCDAKTACGAVNVAWGTDCKSGPTGFVNQFCVGSMCTGLQGVVSAVPGGSNGKLSDVGRLGKGPINASGWSGLSWQNYNTSGLMFEISAVNLGLAARGNAVNWGNTQVNAFAANLAVGSWNNYQYFHDMTQTATAGFWTSNNNANLYNNNYSYGTAAVDLIPGGGTYVYGGSYTNQNNYNSLSRLTFANNNWGNPVTMLVAASPFNCGSQANQVRMRVADIYAADGTNVFVAGTAYTGGNVATNATVAFWDGNTSTNCANIGNFNGIAWTNSAVHNGDFSAPLSIDTMVGELRAVHGTSAKNVMTGGALGSLFSFDGLIWKQQKPAYTGMPVAWSSAFDVKSIAMVDTHAWVGGEYYYLSGTMCRSFFLLHGTLVDGNWVWDKLLITNASFATCSGNNTEFTSMGRIWIDPQSGSLYVVGAQGTDNNGGVVSTNTTQSRPFVGRIVLK
jgi:hypothetical protein